MRSQWCSALAGALLGAALVALFLYADAIPPVRGPLQPMASHEGLGDGDSERVSAALRAELARSRVRSEELEQKLSVLEQRLASFLSAEETGSIGPLAAPHAAREPQSGPDSNSSEPWFDSDSLIAMGLPDSEVERIQAVWETYTLRKLRIQNQRERRGKDWKEVHDWIFLTEADAREELGDESYEAMRYAAGERNRVIFSELLENSPAAEVGLEPGDELISYDGQRVFGPSELKRLIAEGIPASWVEIQVLRGEDLRRVFVKREPIGVRLEFSRRPPYRAF